MKLRITLLVSIVVCVISLVATQAVNAQFNPATLDGIWRGTGPSAAGKTFTILSDSCNNVSDAAG
jgi:hypothetical protein